MSIRTERLASLLKEDLGNILQKDYQKGNIITITSIRVTPDLSIAKVYLSILAPGGDEQEVFNCLQEHNTAIRTKLAHLIRHQVRKIPELHFYLDDTAEYVNKIENLFNKIKKDKED
ncbi:MAG: 30S ribosome-binding factor RbfA [Balneolales bacterium]